MKRNTTLIRIICCILCLVLTVSMLDACKKSKSSKKVAKKKKNTTTTSDFSEYESNYSDDYSGDEWEEEESEELEEGELEEELDIDYTELTVYNNQAPTTTNYQGISASVYHPYDWIKDDNTGRYYTDEMKKIELKRLKEANIHYCRGRYSSKWIWDTAKDDFDFNGNRFNWYCEYAKDLQNNNLFVNLNLGWAFTSLLSYNTTYDLGEITYLYGNGADKHGESTSWKKYVATEFKKTGSQKPESEETGFPDTSVTALYNRLEKASLRYAYFVVETVKNMKARGIHNVSHITYFTESCIPYADFDSTTGLAPYRGDTSDMFLFTTKTIVNVIRGELKGYNIKNVGPNQSAEEDRDDGMLRYVYEKDPNAFDVWSSHTYPSANNSTDDSYYEICSSLFENYSAVFREKGTWADNEFMVDEFFCKGNGHNLGDGDAWASLQTVVGAIAAQQWGIENMSLWQIFDQKFVDRTQSGGQFQNGIHVCGTCPSLYVSTIPRASYYPISLFTRYNGYKNGTAYVTTSGVQNGSDSSVYIGATKLEDGNWTITVVNTSIEDVPAKINFEKAIGKTLYRHVETVTKIKPTTAARIADADKTYRSVKDRFVDSIPACSVVVYTSVKG